MVPNISVCFDVGFPKSGEGCRIEGVSRGPAGCESFARHFLSAIGVG